MNKCLNKSNNKNNNNLSKEISLEDKPNNSPETPSSINTSNKNENIPKEIDLMPKKYVVLGVKSITELPNNNFNNSFNTNKYNTERNKSHSLNKSLNKENTSILSKANTSLNISNSNYKIKRFRKDNQISESESSDEIETEKFYAPTQGEMTSLKSNNFSFYNKYGVCKNLKFNNRVSTHNKTEGDKFRTSESSNKIIKSMELSSDSKRNMNHNELANRKNKNESFNISINQSNRSINKNTANSTKRHDFNNEDIINQTNKDTNTNLNDKNNYKEETKVIFLENKENQKEIINNVKNNDYKDYAGENCNKNYNDKLNDEPELELGNNKGGVITFDMYNINCHSSNEKNEQRVSKDFNLSKVQETKINISYLHEQMYSNNLEDNKITIPNQINTSISDFSDYSKKKSYKNNNYNSENTIYSVQKTISKNDVSKGPFEYNKNKNKDYKICNSASFEINTMSKINKKGNKTKKNKQKEVIDDYNEIAYEDTNSNIENKVVSYNDGLNTKLKSSRKLYKQQNPISKNTTRNNGISKKILNNLIYDYSDKRLLNSMHKSLSYTNLDFYPNKTNSTTFSNTFSVNPYALESTPPYPSIPRRNTKKHSLNHKKITSSLSHPNQSYQINEYSISYNNKAHEKISSSKDLNVLFSSINGFSIDSFRDLSHTNLNYKNLFSDDDLSNYSNVPFNDIKYKFNSPQMIKKSTSSTNISSANSRLNKKHIRNPSWSMVERILTDENIQQNKNLNYENNINIIKNLKNKKMSDMDENDRINLLKKYGVVMNNDDNQINIDNCSPEENCEMNDEGIINNDNNPQSNQIENNENQELKNDQDNSNNQTNKFPDDNKQRTFNYIYHYSENPYYNIDISPSYSSNYKATAIKQNSINKNQNEQNDPNKYKDNKLLKSNITQKFLNKKNNSNIICVSPTDFHYGTTFHPGQSVNSLIFNMSKNSSIQSNTNMNKNKNKKNKQVKNLNNSTKKDLINFQHGKFAFEYSDIYHKLKSMEMNNASQEGFFDNSLCSKGNTASNNFFTNTHNLNYSNNLSGSSCCFNEKKNNTMPCRILNNKLNNENEREEYAKMYSNLDDFKRKKMY